MLPGVANPFRPRGLRDTFRRRCASLPTSIRLQMLLSACTRISHGPTRPLSTAPLRGKSVPFSLATASRLETSGQ